MRLTKETLTLDCKLTDKEFMDAASELGGFMQKESRLEDELAAHKKYVGAQIAELQSKINVLRDKLATRMEKRAIICKVEYNWDKKEKTWIRPDTNEVVKDDIISESDLQEHIDLENKKTNKGKGGKQGDAGGAKSALMRCAVHGTVMSADQCYRCWKKKEGDVNTKSRPECKKKNATVVEPDPAPPKTEEKKPEEK